jgi:hypothetical protein
LVHKPVATRSEDLAKARIVAVVATDREAMVGAGVIAATEALGPETPAVEERLTPELVGCRPAGQLHPLPHPLLGLSKPLSLSQRRPRRIPQLLSLKAVPPKTPRLETSAAYVAARGPDSSGPYKV